MSVALEQELETFHRELPRLLAEGHRGKFALVGGGRVVGVWPTEDEAIEQGYERFDLDPFLVKQIVEHERPQYTSRNLKPCP